MDGFTFWDVNFSSDFLATLVMASKLDLENLLQMGVQNTRTPAVDFYNFYPKKWIVYYFCQRL